MNATQLLDSLIPDPDVRKRHAVTVNAPAELVYEVACHFDLQTIPVVKLLFWLRARFMGADNRSSSETITPLTLLDHGWGKLAEQPGRYFIAGAACQPWQADVVFTPIPAEQFSAYSQPDQVKIVWTLETESAQPNKTRLSTETRVAATDEQARQKFRRYWRKAGMGIIAIRWMLLPGIRKEVRRRSESIKT